MLQAEDILVARTGGTTGKSFLIKDAPNSVFASYLIRLRAKDGILPDYLYHFFQSPSYWQQIEDKKSGTGQPNVNATKLQNIEVPIYPMEEQKRIVQSLAKLQARIEQLQKAQKDTAKELEALLPSILDKAFQGEL